MAVSRVGTFWRFAYFAEGVLPALGALGPFMHVGQQLLFGYCCIVRQLLIGSEHRFSPIDLTQIGKAATL